MNHQELLVPLLLWMVLTIVYGVTLQVFRSFEEISFLYHIGLLLLGVYFARGWNGLGLKVGVFRYGAPICVGFLALVLVRTLFLVTPKYGFGLDLATFSTVFFAPVTEELFWRGLVLQRMLNISKVSAEAAIITNAALFGLMHLPSMIFFNEGALYLVSVIAYGAFFAFTYFASKSVYYPIIMHIIENIFAT